MRSFKFVFRSRAALRSARARSLVQSRHAVPLVASAACTAEKIFANRGNSARHYSSQSVRATAAKTYTPIGSPSLSGQCKCGSVGWKASGPSAINFVCHCSKCRQASGRDALPAAGFRPEQVGWVNGEGIEARKPEGSRNTRFFCKKCGDYIGEDATTPLGIIALPTHVAKGEVDDCYKPNHHIFYADRVADANDAITKWETLPDGKCLSPPAAGNLREDSGDAWRYDPSTGRFRKDVLPFAPVRGPYAKEYVFTESDPVPNHETYISPEKVQERVAKKYYPSPGAFVAPAKNTYDVIVVGGGHNGLVSAAYLAKEGLDVLVLERRDVIGGAAVTEEIVPGFKFSRGSYLAGLLRPKIIEDLELEKYGFKYLIRKPSSFTPSPVNGPYGGKSLILGDDRDKDHASIAQFSARDADAYFEYEEFLGKIRQMVNPLLDGPPPDPFAGRGPEKRRTLAQIKDMVKVGFRNRETLVPFYELLTAPAAFILDRWFEHEMLKTTLATDAVIGAMCSPYQAGSAYVLLHHVMGSAAGREGVWAYVEGGMGAITRTMSESARAKGVTIAHNATVASILYEQNPAKGNARVKGVKMADGTELYAKTVLSNATPYHTFLELLPGLSRDSGNALEESPLPPDFVHHIRYADYSCGAFKINCAVDKLPDFECLPNHLHGGGVGRQHRGTVHFENKMEEIDNAWREASMGMPATRPVLEMTIPTSVDTTIAPPGKHVVQLFVQFAPYDVHPKIGNWADPDFKNAFADRCFSIVDEFAPGFSSSVIGRDVLTPLDLERIFGLHKGNIMHGALSLHQLAFARPMNGYARHRTPLDGLYICGAGAHPGGGVMGAAGRNCAHIVMSDVLGK